jgi:hypothetical protein
MPRRTLTEQVEELKFDADNLAKSTDKEILTLKMKL